MNKMLRYREHSGPMRTFLVAALLTAVLLCVFATGVYADGGDIEWQYRDSRGGKQIATAAALDPVSGELVITGYSDSNGDDFHTVRLKADGSALKWTAPAFDLSGGEDRPVAVVVDSMGDAIVAGYATNSGGNVDFHIAKYRGSTGGLRWERTYNHSGNGDDYPVAVALDYLNNIYVAGFSPGSNGKDDGLIVKYSTGGARMWAKTINNIAENDHDRITAMTAGMDGIAVTGKSLTSANGWEILTVKYDFYGTKLWETVRVGSFGNDEGIDLAMDATGDVVVTGTVLNDVGNEDIYTVKYDGSAGTVIGGMEMIYADPDNGPDRPRDLALDANGDIFITGETFTVAGMNDFVTIKYSGSTGNELWKSLYNSGGNNTDIPVSMLINNVSLIVTGYTTKDGADDDFTTLKYKSDNGHELWPVAASYNNAAVSKDDVAVYVGLDVNGKVYVAGWSDKSSSAALDYDYYAIRYDPGDLNTPTGLNATVVDENTIDLFWTDNSNAPNPNETEFLIERKIGAGGTYVEVDTVGQDVTTYRDNDQGAGLTPHTKYYYRVRGYNTALEEHSHYSPEIYAKTTVVNLNTDPGWVFRYDGPDNSDDVAMDIAVGPDLDPVVTGFSTISASFDYYTVKLRHDLVYSDAASVSLDLNGDGLADIRGDFTVPLAVDSSVVFDTTLGGAVIEGIHSGDAAGNTALTTVTVPENNEDTINRDAVGITVSWDSTNLLWTLTNTGGYSGASVLDGYVGQLWDDHYDDPGNGEDMAQCLTVDQDNDVVVSGDSYLFTSGYGSTNDAYTRKYPASGPPPFGDPFIWEDQYDGSGGDDYSQSIEAVSDGSGNVVVAGYGQNIAGNNDIYVIYYLDDGTRFWADEYDYAAEDDRPVGLAYDPDGDIIMTGRVMVGGSYDIITRKYCVLGTSAACVAAAKVAGEVIWTVAHDSGNGDDEPAGVATDSDGDVYVAGFVTGSGGSKDTYIVKLSSTDGAELWGAPLVEDGPGNGDDRIVGIKMDPNDDEFVAAATWNLGPGNNEFRMTRYTKDGSVVWDEMYDSPGTDDKVQALGMDRSGNICVAGTMGVGGSTDLLAVKYDYTGEILGSTSYDGGHVPPVDDQAAAIAFNNYGEGFVAGNTQNPAGDYDYLVMLCEGYVLQAPSPFTVTPYYLSAEFTWANNAPGADSFTLDAKVGACPIADTDSIWQRTFGAEATGHTETGLAMGQTYCFRLKTSVTATGEDSRWLYRQVTTSRPPAPVNFSATSVTTTRTQLAWDDVLNGEESFSIERCEDIAANCGTSDAAFNYIGSAGADAVSFDDPSVCPGQSYTYRIRGTNTLWGEEPLWAYAEVTTMGTNLPVITSVISTSEGRIDLSWLDSNGDETGFEIYRCAGPGCTIDTAVDTPVALVASPVDSIFSLKMDESGWTSGNPDVLDSSGNNLHGTPYNDADRGVFDGADDYVDMGDIDVMDAPAAFSVELRFRRDSETALATNHNINNVLIAQSSVGANDNFEIGTDGTYIELYLDTAGDVNETKSVELGLAVDGNIQDNIWYHLVFTYDKDAADTFEAKLYLDGALLAQWDDPDGLLSDSVTSPLTIGMARPDGEAVTPTGLWGDFNGEFDEVTLYNRALTGVEVADYYNNGNIPTTYTDLLLDPDQTYRYMVTAVKTTPTTCGTGPGWESSASDYDQGATSLPAAPILLSAVQDPVEETTNINLSWQDNTEFEENFIIERCTGDCSGAFVVDDSFSTGSNPGLGGIVNWSDTAACSGTYTYRVKAGRNTAPVWETAASVEELAASTISPAAPAGMSAVQLNEEDVELSWTDNTNDESSFIVERCIGASCVEVSFPASPGTGIVTYVDTRLIPGTTYDYRVKAEKAAGPCSWQSAYTAPQVSASTVAVPITLSAVSPNTTQLDLSWTDTTAHETGFILERCDGDCTGSFAVDQTYVLDAGVAGYSDTSVCENSQYSYRVRAVSQDLPGGMNGCWTKRQKITVTPFAPNTVIEFTVDHVVGMQDDFGDLRFYSFSDSTETYGVVIPHWFDKKTDGSNAVVWLRTPAAGDNLYLYWGNTEALDASTGEGVFEFFDDFQGTVIDTAKWQENDDAENEIYQDDGLYLDYVDSSWLSLISQRTFAREGAPIVYVRWTPLAAAHSTRQWYGGWQTDQTSSTSVADFAHSFGPYYSYINYTYELNVNRGRDYIRYYAENYQYDSKVAVEPGGGARSYLRGGYDHAGAMYRHPDWDLVKDTTALTGSDLVTTDPLRVGILQRLSDTLIHSIGVLNGEPAAPSVVLDSAADVVCNDLPHIWTGDDSNLITPITQAAANPTSFIPTVLSESEIKLTWQDETGDETGFLLERCEGNDADCVAAGAPDFDWSLMLPAVEVATPTVEYLMEEASWPNTADDVQDSSGNGNHGSSFNGANIVTDPERGLVGEFDGVDDYIEISNSASLQELTDGSFTFSAWVRPDTIPPATETNPPANDYSYTIISRPGWHTGLFYNRFGKFQLTAWNDSDQAFAVASPNTYAPGSWHHVVGVVDDLNKKITLFVDDREQGSLTYTGALRDFGTSPYYVGATPGAAYTYHFDGRIDDARIYDYVLTTTTYVDSGLSLSTEYTYRLRGVKDSSICTWDTGDTVRTTATTLAPPKPTNLAATPFDTTRIDLVWDDNTTSNTGFAIERCLGDKAFCDADPDNRYSPLATVGPNDEAYSDIDVCNGTQYMYRIRAVGDEGGVPWPDDWSDASNPVTTTAKETPALNTVTRISETRIDLAWTDSNLDETGFELERCVGADCVVVPVAGGMSGHSDAGLNSATTYCYRLRAVKTGTSCDWQTDYDPVAPLCATTSIDSPAITATTAPTDTTRVDLDWTDPTESESAFRIWRCNDDVADCSSDANFTDIKNTGANQNSWSDDTVCSGKTYTYKVEAVSDGLPVNGFSNSGGGAWERRRALSIAGFKPSQVAHVTIPYDSDMQADFDDLRFVDADTGVELPYVIDSKTDGVEASVWFVTGGLNAVNLYYGNASAATSLSTMATVMASAEFFDDFQGTVIDSDKWVEIDTATEQITQNNGLAFSYVDTSWNAALISKQTFTRTEGMVLYMQIYPENGPSTDYMMAGWEMDQTTNPSFNQLIHGLYFYNFGNLKVYEKGANLGDGNPTDYNPDIDYEVKIELQSAGARYYLRGGAYPDWQLIQETASYTDATLRVAFTQNRHQMKVNMVAVAGTMDVTLGSEESTSVEAWNSVRSGPDSVTTTLYSQPVMDQGATTGDTETTIQVSWTDSNTDESWFRIERGDESCANFVEIGQTAGPDIFTYFDTGSDLPGGMLAYNTTYCYRVQAHKDAVSCDWDSGFGSTATASTFIPVPENLVAIGVESTRVELTWDDTSTSETGFIIDRCTGDKAFCDADPENRYSPLVTVGANIDYYSDSSVCPDTAYSYRIKATRSGEWTSNPALSDDATTLGAPVAPSALALTEVYDQLNDSRRIDLLWTDGNAAETGFKIERCDQTVYGDCDTLDTNYSVIGTLLNHDSFTAGINTMWVQGGRLGSSDWDYTPLLNISDATGSVTISEGSGGAVLESSSTAGGGGDWNQALLQLADPASLGSGDLDVEFKWDLPAVVMPEAAAHKHIHSRLQMNIGVDRIILERAVDEVNGSYYWAEILLNGVSYQQFVLTTDTAGKFRMTRVGDLYTLYYWNWQAKAWQAVVSQTGADAGAVPSFVGIRQFAHQSEAGVSLQAVIDDFRINSQIETTYRDLDNLAASTDYYYRVRAFKETTCPAWDNLYTAKVNELTNPAAPVLTATVLGSRKISLVWSDNATDEDGYEIEKMIFGGQFVKIADLGPDSENYTDTTALDPDTTYVYRVRAHRDEYSSYSAYSNEDSATTDVIGGGGLDDTTCE